MESNQPFLQLALNANQAHQELNNWQPWMLIQSLSGHSLKPIIKGLAISINPFSDQNFSGINLRANLQIG